MKLLLLLSLAATTIVLVTGKTPDLQNDQSTVSHEELENVLTEKHFASPVSSLNLGKLGKWGKKKINERYWTKERFLSILRKLGLFEMKEINVITVNNKLIKKLLKSKDNIIDSYKPPSPCYKAIKEAEKKLKQQRRASDERINGENVDEDVAIGDEEQENNNEDVADQDSNEEKVQNQLPEMSDQTEESDVKNNKKDDSNKADTNDETAEEETKMDDESNENARGNTDEDTSQDTIDEKYENKIVEQTEDEDLKKRFTVIAQQNKNAEDSIEKRGGEVDLCRETPSTMYILAHAKFNLVYKIPNVHCPVKFCHSNAFRINFGQCHKTTKTMLLYVINKSSQFEPKTVKFGCACECMFFQRYS